VHKKYKCKPNTLFLAVALTDRYLQRCVTQRRHLQLVGVAGMLVAAKFEEQFPPSVKDFVQVVDRTYSRDEICGMEVSMLTQLGFNVCQPTAFDFMDRFSRDNGCSDRQRHLAHYLLKLILVRALHLQHLPSRLAAAAVVAASCLAGKEPAWEPLAARSSSFFQADINDLCQSMTCLLSDAEDGVGKLQAVRKKFSSDKFLAVAKTSWTCTTASIAVPTRGVSENERPASGSQSVPPPRPSLTPRLSGQA
jgi:cyclin B